MPEPPASQTSADEALIAKLDALPNAVFIRVAPVMIIIWGLFLAALYRWPPGTPIFCS